LFEQLRGAANARERVLDFVRQHRSECDHRARRAAMGELAIHLVRDGALLEHHHHMTGLLGHRRDIEIDQPLARISRRREIDAIFIHRRTAIAHLLDQRQQRRAERHEIAQRVAAQQQHRDFEERFGGDIRLGDLAVGRHHQHRVRQRVEHRVGGVGRERGDGLGVRHAARLQPKLS
jgi:hypothetical protein